MNTEEEESRSEREEMKEEEKVETRNIKRKTRGRGD